MGSDVGPHVGTQVGKISWYMLPRVTLGKDQLTAETTEPFYQPSL